MSIAKISYGGKEYNITDNVYSEEEHIVGVWTNNKPLYRKVITFSVPPTTTHGVEVTYDFNIGNNIDYSFVESCHMIDVINETYLIPYFNIKSSVFIRAEIILKNNGTGYFINSVSSWGSNCTVVASILYTKTTD